MISNKLREALIASGSDKVQLKFGNYQVRLSAVDKRALVEQPLAFRAGAIGPDNLAFPGMTDPSHAIGQNPYTQCELLYKAALTDEERAYAMGCFLHGVTDAIAHHYVNFMSGETFTLTPITAGRNSDYSNVVRHIIAESMIQKAAFQQDAQAFSVSQLIHTIPTSFLLRTYLDTSSPLWQLMARHAKKKYDDAVAAQPSASLVTIVQGLDIAPADHLVLSPVYVSRIELVRQQVQSDVQAAVASMQNRSTPEGAQLQVTAGSDGQLGTSDDKTACTTSCPDLYAKYFVYVALLAPRFDAQNRQLPSALEKISDKLRDDLGQFLPAYLSTVQSLSSKLNEPLTTGTEGFDLSAAQIDMLFKPMTDWATQITTLDYQTVITAVVPEWLIKLQQAFQSVGINVSIPNIVKTLLEPFVRPIKDAIKAYVIDQAKLFVTDITNKYRLQLDAVTAEYEARLKTYAAAGLTGTMLDHFYESGLFGHAFNIAAASLANHVVALPVGTDEVGIGPASFDASHTPAWMQPALCEYIREPIFPLGLGVAALLSVKTANGQLFTAQVSGDSPVECHDGSLSMFTAAPSADACKLVETPALVLDSTHRGSPTRAYPPDYAASMPTCQNPVVPGLPEPPSLAEDQGCGCRVAGGAPSSSGTLAVAAILFALLVSLRRRSWRWGRAGFVSAALLLAAPVGCGGSNMTGTADMNPDSGGSTAQQTLAALNNSVWQGNQTRTENGVQKQRAYELRFNSTSLFWSETRNPFGPARRRELRAFSIDDDGATLHSTVITPTDWTDPDKQNGRKDDWTVTVIPGTPRQLKVVRKTAPETTEVFIEGTYPAPTDGLTATVRVFPASGKVDKAFCVSAALFDYPVFFDFARGRSAEPLLGSDIMAGAKLNKWHDGTNQNRFAVTDVPGFSNLGGTALSDQSNFFVHYQGVINHPGGNFQVREQDDSVEDGVWVFIGDKVGSSNTNDLFLEVQGFVTADKTPDAPSTNLAAGSIPIEIITVRCAKQIKDQDVEIKLGSGNYQLIGNAPSTPSINNTLFPAAQ